MCRATAVRSGLLRALAAATVAIYPLRHAIDLDAFERAVRDAGAWGPLLHMALDAPGTVVSFPGAIPTLAGGALLGPVSGAVYVLTGATVGATAAFSIARYLASG